MPHFRAICFDFGDTLADEATEEKDDGGVTLRASLLPGAASTLRGLRRDGYRLALVADGRSAAYDNVLSQHRLEDVFEARAVSDAVGVEKPNPAIFVAALDQLGIRRADYGMCMMVGNRLDRDVLGANALGLISVWLNWNRRYRMVPRFSDEKARHRIERLADLPPLIHRAEHDP